MLQHWKVPLFGKTLNSDLMVPLSTRGHMYEWVPVNLGRATNPPIQGAKIYFRVALYYRKSEVEISVGLMVY